MGASETGKVTQPAVERPERAAAEPKTAQRNAVRTKERPGVSAFAVVGFLCIAGLLFMVLLSYVSLTELSEETVGLKEELAVLEEEETRLLLKYESAFDLNAVESYATNVLGMSKPGENQIFYIRSENIDRAMILGSDQSNSDLMRFLGSVLTKLTDLFG